jgi:hypothetical protein
LSYTCNTTVKIYCLHPRRNTTGRDCVSPRDEYYHSPYYYDNYPPDYAVYEVVETPVYRTRVERIDPQPVFVYTRAPEFVDRVKIKSPYRGRQMDKIYARLAKPTRQQIEFIRSNPRGPQVAKAEREAKPNVRGGDKPGRPDFAPRAEPQQRNEVRRAEPERGGPPKAFKADRPNMDTTKPARFERPKGDTPRPVRVQQRPNVNPPRVERPNFNPSKPARVERPNFNPLRPARVERPNFNPSKPARVERPNFNPSSPARVERPNMNAPKPARVEQPRMSPSSPAYPGNGAARGGGKGKKP